VSHPLKAQQRRATSSRSLFDHSSGQGVGAASFDPAPWSSSSTYAADGLERTGGRSSRLLCVGHDGGGGNAEYKRPPHVTLPMIGMEMSPEDPPLATA
jgi:hypothetical protein